MADLRWFYDRVGPDWALKGLTFYWNGSCAERGDDAIPWDLLVKDDRSRCDHAAAQDHRGRPGAATPHPHRVGRGLCVCARRSGLIGTAHDAKEGCAQPLLAHLFPVDATAGRQHFRVGGHA